MRVGLYGMPTAGKSYILNEIRNFEVINGSDALRELSPNFSSLSEIEKKDVRESLAKGLMAKDNFVMDGHYSFGDKVVFTDYDGELYDVFIYLYINPDVLQKRMEDSVKNRKYLEHDLEKWQEFEIDSIRSYCHEHDKDFYVIDNPEKGYFGNIDMILSFFDSIWGGFSCKKYAQQIVENILERKTSSRIVLADGDKTLINEDSSGLIGYTTHIFDGNFYTGFQSWRHHNELGEYLKYLDFNCPNISEIGITYDDTVVNDLNGGAIITSGYYGIWKQISEKLGISLYHGNQISAETKYYVTKYLQNRGCKVVAYGDSMNDYYMLKQADEGYLKTKMDGSISRSLKEKSLEGIVIV